MNLQTDDWGGSGEGYIPFCPFCSKSINIQQKGRAASKEEQGTPQMLQAKVRWQACHTPSHLTGPSPKAGPLHRSSWMAVYLLPKRHSLKPSVNTVC